MKSQLSATKLNGGINSMYTTIICKINTIYRVVNQKFKQSGDGVS